MAVDERRRDEPSLGVQLAHAVRCEIPADARPPPTLREQVDAASVQQGRIADDEVDKSQVIAQLVI